LAIGEAIVPVPEIPMALEASDLPHPLSFAIEADDREARVSCSGDLTYESAASFKAHVKPLLSECSSVLLDFADVAYVDSSGLGALVGIYATAKGAGRELRLRNVQPRVHELLKLTHLLAIFRLE
jgi:anti-sigma B factor antagonist